MTQSKVRSIFGRPLQYPSDVYSLVADLNTLGISSEFCPEIKQLIGKKITENCDYNLELKDGKLHIKNLRSTMSSQRLAGIVEFLDVVRRYCKSTSWKSIGPISLFEYVNCRITNDFLKQVF